MSSITVRITPREGDPSAEEGYRPGETIECTAEWSVDEPPRAIEANLVWHTRGIGNEDVGIGATVREESPLATGERTFALVAPDFPYTFSGKLISLDWEIEVQVIDARGRGRESVQERVVIAPEGVELDLEASGTRTAEES